jgi:hypothetical protein
MAIRLNQISDLSLSRSAQDLVQHHQNVLSYYAAEDKKLERGFNFLRGEQLTAAEKEGYRERGRTPVIFNKLKTSERSMLGVFLKRKMDMKWATNKPVDQDLSTIMEALRLWDAENCEDEYNDVELIRQAWAGRGVAYQECYVSAVPGKMPRIKSNSLNPYYVHFDPESRMLISRKDAQFVDVDSFATKEQLVEAWPKAKELIERGKETTRNDVNSYSSVARVYNDRGAQVDIERNGKYKVTERYYRIRKSYFYCIMRAEQKTVEINEEEINLFKKKYPDEKINSGFREELWLAVVCEGISNTVYLHNEKYHTQVIDPKTERVMFPILEYAIESLNGDPSSFVEHEIDPQKVINAMIGNIVNSATHGASSAKLMNAGAFINEKEAQNAANYHSDSNKVFRVKSGFADKAIQNIENNNVSSDVHSGLDYANAFQEEVSGTPKNMQGAQEKQESGVLYSQRLEQSLNQLQVVFLNYKHFLEQRTRLRYMYQRLYYTEEMTFKVVDKTLLKETPLEGQEFLTINKKIPAMDHFGNHIPGEVKVVNAINDALFSLTAEESVKSTSYRQKVMAQLEVLLQSPAAQNDPVLMAGLFLGFLDMSDAPEAMKELARNRSSILEQHDQQKMQQEQLANAQQEQNIRQQEQQEQEAAMEARKMEMEFQSDQDKNQIDLQKNALEARKLRLEEEELRIKLEENKIKLMESRRNLSSADLDDQLKAADLELKDLDADLKQVEVSRGIEEVAQLRAESTGVTVMDLKEEQRTARDAAMKEATKNGTGSHTRTQKEA